ncbi:MAG: GMP synthase subunit A [Methanobacteriota archaeon]|nr:MAG: GMP synthase subunit A [Euryarchaeota archaeon]
MIAVIANRGQYNHRIYRTLKYLGADARLLKNDITPEELRAMEPDAIVIGGGPFLEETGNSQAIIKAFYREVPLLGICLGHQLIAKAFGGEVKEAEIGEYAESEIIVDDEDALLQGTGPSFRAWVSHKDEVKRMPEGFIRLAHSETCQVEAMRHRDHPVFGVQFHPEVEHTPKGPQIFRNFMGLCRDDG